MTTTDRIARLNADMAAIKAEIDKLAKEEGGNVIREMMQPIFDLGVTFVRWTQYTPYFNDGDPCEFGVNADFTLGWPGGIEDDLWEIGYRLKEFTPYNYQGGNTAENDRRNAEYKRQHDASRDEAVNAGITAEFIEAVKAVCKPASQFLNDNENLLKAAFGDHASITVTPEGIEVDEYSHD
jgi:hypothetical protein